MRPAGPVPRVKDMSLQITGKNMDIGAALRQRAEERVEAAVTKYFDGSYSGTVVVGHDGGGYRTDCTVHLSTGPILKTSATSTDPTASFEIAAERIEKRLRRYKRRLKSHHANHVQAEPAVEAQSYVLATPEEDEEIPEDFTPVIVAEASTPIRTMTVGMAVLELDLTEAPVLVFRSAANGAVNVVYRRADGNFGWIDPAMTAPEGERA